MDTFTTPARSQSTPQSAPKTSGVASDRVPANWLLTGNGRSRPAAAQVRKPITRPARPRSPASAAVRPREPSAQERRPRRRGTAPRRRPRWPRPAAPRSAAEPRRTRPTARTRRAARGRAAATSRSTADDADQDAGGEALPPLLGRLDVRVSSSGSPRRAVAGDGSTGSASLTPDLPRRTGPTASGLAGPDERDDRGDQRGCGDEQHDQRLQHRGQGQRRLGDALHGQTPGVQGTEQQPGQHRAERLGPAEQRDGDRVEADGADDARPTAARARRTPSGRARPARRPVRPAPPASTMVMTVVRADAHPGGRRGVRVGADRADGEADGGPVEQPPHRDRRRAARRRSRRAAGCPPAAGTSRSSRRSGRSGRCGRAAGTPWW